MKKKVYHCSPDLISKFDFQDGVHFGGLTSALEAGLRKHCSLSTRGVPVDNLYIHTCLLDTSVTYKTTDVGNKERWFDEANFAQQEDCQVLEYKNIYEPDIEPSYYVLDKHLITLQSIQVLTKEEAIDSLEDRLDQLQLYT